MFGTMRLEREEKCMQKVMKSQPEGWITLRHKRRDYGFCTIGQNIIYTFVTGCGSPMRWCP